MKTSDYLSKNENRHLPHVVTFVRASVDGNDDRRRELVALPTRVRLTLINYSVLPWDLTNSDRRSPVGDGGRATGPEADTPPEGAIPNGVLAHVTTPGAIMQCLRANDRAQCGRD